MNRWLAGIGLFSFSAFCYAEPISAIMTTIGPALSAIGTAVSVVGAFSQGRQSSDAAKYNAKLAEQNAVTARQQGAAQQEQQRKMAEKKIGSMAAAYSASGVSYEGSPLDVLAESAGNAELDYQTIKYNTELRAMGYNNTASLERSKASNAMTSGYMNAASSMLKGAGSLSGPTVTPKADYGNYSGFVDQLGNF